VTLPLSYFMAAALSISAFGTTPPIWLSNAFVVVVLLRSKRSTWPVLLFAAAIADYAASARTGSPLTGCGFIACNIIETLLVAALSSSSDTALPSDFNILSRFRLVIVCLLVPVVSTAGGAGFLALSGAHFFRAWKMWYLSDASGLLIVVPLLLSWTDPTLDRSHRPAVQTVLIAGLVAVVGLVIFNNPVPWLYLVFPFLLLATFSGRLLGATTATAALTVVAIPNTLAGHGPIAAYAGADAMLKLQLLQLYLAVVLLSTLPVAAILEQREKLMMQLRESTKTAQEAARAKAEFMAVMSHEIRTPMTAVLGMAELLLHDDLSEKSREYVAAIQSSGRHLLALINDILDFSRAEARKLNPETIDFDLRELLEQVRALLAPQAAERGLELRFEHDALSPLVLRGDPTRLQQVLVNLVGNGLKFTPRGSVTVTVRQHVAQNRQDWFRFEVRDTGIGIPEDKQGILFNAFSQMDTSTTRKYGGSGLGLAISSKLVEAMGGEIGVESRPSEGSLFWFELPLEPGITTPQETEQRVLVASPPRFVLLVDDVELNRVLIIDMLRSYGHEVIAAENGQEAVLAAAREPFDVVLMDVQMPVMDGVEATRQIRRLPPPAGAVPILALSASVIPEERNRCLAAGMNGILAKPIDWPQLFAALAKYGPPQERAEPDATATPGPDLPMQARAAARVATPSDPPLDDALFNRLRHFQGGGDFSAKLAEIFTRDTARRLEELRDAVRRADAPAIAQMAHAIKGSAASLGAQIMVEICMSIETSAKAADLAAAPERLDALQQEFARVSSALAGKEKNFFL
jgi:signal transduction histidine kinase/HPt (histidine-containing phosphotransfer) domain-containing protein